MVVDSLVATHCLLECRPRPPLVPPSSSPSPILSSSPRPPLVRYALKAFTEVDVDGSGAIDHTESVLLVQSIAEKMGLPLPTTEKILQLVKKMDKSGDGDLQLGEFLSFFKAVLLSAVRRICVIKIQSLVRQNLARAFVARIKKRVVDQD